MIDILSISYMEVTKEVLRMFRTIKYKQQITLLAASLFFVLLAIGSSILLGSLYINILAKGSKSDGSFGAKEVLTIQGKNNKTVFKIDSYPVYFLQAGVYSDLKGAQKSVEYLKGQGFQAYPSKISPFKVYLGIYLDREAAIEAQKNLDVKNISSYISSYVMNGSDLFLPEQKDIKDPDQLLKQLNEWNKTNISFFEKKFENVSKDDVNKLNIKSQQFIKSMESTLPNMDKAPGWFKYILAYQTQLGILVDNLSVDNFNISRVKMTEAICEYINWTQQFVDK